MAATVAAEPLTTNSLVGAMKLRYDGDSWALMFNVGDGTGSAQSGWADAIAMSLWPSRGLHLHGFEFKASRTDWLKELKQPQKADKFWRFVDYWWLVVTDRTIVRDGELPPTWGLLALDKRSMLRVVTQAAKLTPQPLCPAFLAGMLRAAGKPVAKENRDAFQAAYDRGWSEGQKHSQDTRLSQTLKNLQGNVDAFEKASGIRITEYHNGSEHAATVKAVIDGKWTKLAAQRDLQEIRRCVVRITDVLRKSGLVGEIE